MHSGGLFFLLTFLYIIFFLIFIILIFTRREIYRLELWSNFQCSDPESLQWMRWTTVVMNITKNKTKIFIPFYLTSSDSFSLTSAQKIYSHLCIISVCAGVCVCKCVYYVFISATLCHKSKRYGLTNNPISKVKKTKRV